MKEMYCLKILVDFLFILTIHVNNKQCYIKFRNEDKKHVCIKTNRNHTGMYIQGKFFCKEGW